jgi:glycosyltransferase involved in cell wall biosynthesis
VTWIEHPEGRLSVEERPEDRRCVVVHPNPGVLVSDQVLLEAMACGTPVVATAVGGVAEVLRYGDAVLLVPPQDVEAFVEAIELPCVNSDLRTRLLMRGLRLAVETSLDVEAPRVAAFLHQASRDRRATVGPVAR